MNSKYLKEQPQQVVVDFVLGFLITRKSNENSNQEDSLEHISFVGYSDIQGEGQRILELMLELGYSDL